MLVIIALTVTMMMGINSMYGKAFADPAHCDRPGWPSCYKVGYDDSLGMSGPCPSGHSSEFCRGWDDAISGSNNNGSSQALEQNASEPPGTTISNITITPITPEFLKHQKQGTDIDILLHGTWDFSNGTDTGKITFYKIFWKEKMINNGTYTGTSTGTYVANGNESLQFCRDYTHVCVTPIFTMITHDHIELEYSDGTMLHLMRGNAQAEENDMG